MAKILITTDDGQVVDEIEFTEYGLTVANTLRIKRGIVTALELENEKAKEKEEKMKA